ncbi:MAG: Ig-like domain-containing protein, partial [Gemmatimonadota bacterium]|nr:Ig-like domain-containing protein [Gemmatimonadota bacterium]
MTRPAQLARLTRTLPVIAIAATLAAITATPTAAQFPPATDDQRAAGAMVTEVRFGSDELVIPRGETVTLATGLYDVNGTMVEGAVAIIMTSGNVSPRFATITGQQVELTGQQPGEGALSAIVMVPLDQGSVRGTAGASQLSQIPVRVLDYPAASITISEPSHTVYTGTSIQMVGQVMTENDTEHSTATITWRSSATSVAMISNGGILTGISEGSARLTAQTEGGISAEYTVNVATNPVTSISMSPASTQTRRGDVVEFDIVARDSGGNLVTDIALDLAVSGLEGTGGFVYDDGTFVAEEPGAYRVIASTGSASAASIVEVAERPGPIEVEFLDHGVRAEVATSDLWVFEGADGEDYAYTGTHSRGGGERMFVWHVTDPTNISLLDSVVVDARVVNDVKVNEDASWAIITREGASTRRNGIVVLDLADPAHPTIMAELTDQLTAGIHNVWIMGDVVYAVNNGTSAMNIIDMSDPSNPTHAGRYEIRPGDQNKSLHDVWAEDGYAYLSYWDDGLVIVDVGAGTHGGTPTEPVFVSTIKYPEGNTHVAWRTRDYVFLGDEIGTSDGMRGFIHIIDVSDIDNPRQVAKYDLPEAGAHNIWVEDDVLYIAYYQGGLRIVDVSGTLRGDLYRQGREIGFFRTEAAEGEGLQANSANAWGPQPFKG